MVGKLHSLRISLLNQKTVVRLVSVMNLEYFIYYYYNYFAFLVTVLIVNY